MRRVGILRGKPVPAALIILILVNLPTAVETDTVRTVVKSHTVVKFSKQSGGAYVRASRTGRYTNEAAGRTFVAIVPRVL